MAEFRTPVRTRSSRKTPLDAVKIPPSPFLKKLGYGTGVAVYKLERSPIANKVQSPWAIKKLVSKHILPTDNFSKRLKFEATVLRQLNHPHIVGFRGLIKSADNKDCLAMEECSGCLGDEIEKRNNDGLLAFPAKQIMKVALDVSQALNYLHTEALLLHCDVKSYNVLINGDFAICKLCDFGVSLPLTKNGEIDTDKAGLDVEYVGTQLWSAPEIVAYPQVITTKADIFSYGLVLWEMMSLSPPFVDELDESAMSTDNFEDSIASKCKLGTRPELPSQEFDDSYQYALEIFHCCTENKMKDRPSALDLTISIPEMIKAIEMD